MNNDSRRRNSPAQIVTFIAAVVGGTAAIIALTYWMTNSWAVGTAGVIAAVLSASMHPVLLRKR